MNNFFHKLVDKRLFLFSIFVGLLLLLGIFIRTVHFHEWLRMNADQARDAMLVSAVVDGSAAWPLLGPKAGGTNFRLGPAFYDFEILSAKLFGNHPVAMAYPDLLCSLLTIPLLFFFLRKYFNQTISLSLMALLAVSFYAVKYSRFAWNPNSTPFWTLLLVFALLQIFASQPRRRVLWSVVAGIAVGVGVQLHTFLLAALPVLVILSFGYLSIRGRKLAKYFCIILFVSLALNTPQFIHEAQSNGENVKALFGGMKAKQETSRSVSDKVLKTSACYVAANIQILSSAYYDDDTCDMYHKKSPWTLFVGLSGIIFLFGGAILAIRYLRRSTDPDERIFIGLSLSSMALLFLFIMPVAYEISLRYFLVLLFMPFFFLGMWLKFLGESSGLVKKAVPIVLLLVLLSTNLTALNRYFTELSSYAKSSGTGGFDIVYLGEMERMAAYIVSRSGDAESVFLGGNKAYLFKAANALTYLSSRGGVQVRPLEKNKDGAVAPTFYLISTKSKSDFMARIVDVKSTVDAQSFGRFTLVSVVPIVQ